MRLSKKSKEEFDYLTTIKYINKLHGTPKYLSKDNKNQNINNIVKDPTFRETAPIKVRLIKAVNINKNINLYKLDHTNKNSKPFSRDTYNKENKTTKTNLRRANRIKTSKISMNFRVNNEKQIVNKNKSRNETQEQIEISKLYSDIIKDNDKTEIMKYKNLLISPKIMDKDQKINKIINIKTHKYKYGKSSEKENNDNYNKKTFNKNTFNKININKMNLLSPNFTYNKPLKDKALGNTYSVFTKKSNISKDMLYTESKGWGGMSSDNIFSNYDNYSINSKNGNIIKKNNSTNKMNEIENKVNLSTDKIRVNKSNKNKIYNLKTYIRKKHPYMLLSNRQNTSPIKVKNYNNNNSFNITNNNYKYIYLSPKKDIIQTESNYDNIEIKLEELILFEERLNDIYIALNTKNIYDSGASNECIEFIVFYFHSSLKNIFPYFFNGMNKVIIKSATNLKLFSIIITYHLSFNSAILNKLVNELKKIFSLAKINLYLFVKKIQLFYGEKYTKQNSIYFKHFNYILIQNGFMNYNENEIVQIINRNCCEIVNNLNTILSYYKSIENNYYLDFIEIFASISKIKEIEIHSYFYNHLYKNSLTGEPKPKYNPINQNANLNLSESNININTNNNSKKKAYSKNKEKEPEIKTILKYHKYKISPPFLKKPNEKKYTLVLDLEETLIDSNQDGTCTLRPGLFQFLSSVKPYYELISFTNESKYFSDSIIKQIEEKNKYFDYNLYREHLAFNGKEFIKDISKIGRDIKKIIIVDNIANNFKLNPENGIQIAPFFGEYSEKDNVLLELKKLLINFYKSGFEDLREAIKQYAKDIKKNITKEIE